MYKAKYILSIFETSVADWHIEEKESKNPHPIDSMEFILYSKNQIDTIQWHVEDEIRRPDVADQNIVKFKREIDALNQRRTDLVEKLDDYFYSVYKDKERKVNSKMNSETPACLIDRMSILELKIYHMREQTSRVDIDVEHIETCKNKLAILMDQKSDMIVCLDDLFADLESGLKFMKVYRQMKMYNDKNLNPSLYKNTK